ncbi:MAG TPA: hypothetical protein VGA18_04985, partial [Rhodothermales bacterium]
TFDVRRQQSGLFAPKQIDEPEHDGDQEEDHEYFDAEAEQYRPDSEEEAQKRECDHQHDGHHGQS